MAEYLYLLQRSFRIKKTHCLSAALSLRKDQLILIPTIRFKRIVGHPALDPTYYTVHVMWLNVVFGFRFWKVSSRLTEGQPE